MKTNQTQLEELESFEEMCIRTGHKPFGAQGIDFGRYGYNSDGTVFKRINVISYGGGQAGTGGAGGDGNNL